MSGSLTVRNLTAQPLTIKVVERYDTPDAERKTFWTCWTKNGTSPTHGEHGEKAGNHVCQQLNILVKPFTAHKLDTQETEHKPGQLLRLTLHGDGPGRWRIESPAPSATLQKLTPLVPDPAHDYNAICLPSSTLAILDAANLQCWMGDFSEDTSLSALSIPGTHNSPTCYRALPSVRCQAVSVKEQLEHGIRFLDIRVQPPSTYDATDETLSLVHGAFPISLTGAKRFRNLLDSVQEFLEQNPSETVILSLKREGIGNATDEQLSLILRDHYATDPSKWHTEPRIPTLGEVRGKCVLMRRFALADSLRHEWAGRGWGLDAENWEHNTPDCARGDVRVQDFCEVLETETIQKKISLCRDHFVRAGQVAFGPVVPGVNPTTSTTITTTTNDAENSVPRPRPPPPPPPTPTPPMYFNFLTASNFWNVGCWPERIAAKVNPAITAFLVEQHHVVGPGEETIEGDGGLGIVVCDWYAGIPFRLYISEDVTLTSRFWNRVGKDGDWDLVETILAMNGMLLLRQREARLGGGCGPS